MFTPAQIAEAQRFLQRRRRGFVSASMCRARGAQVAAISSPTDLTGLAGWWKADAGTLQTSGGSAAVADADPVGEWQDQSGLGWHWGQTTASFRPTLRTNVQNGLPVIRFDGSDDRMTTASITGMAAHTTYFVVKSGNTTNRYFLAQGGDSNAYIQGFTALKWEWSVSPRTVIADISTAAFQRIYSALGATATGGWTIGNNAGVSSPWAGDVGEIIEYDSAHSAGTQSLVLAYLLSRWGV